jgi:hypothetical protein
MQGRTLLCRSEAERVRLLDMSQRLRAVELGLAATLLVLVGVGIPTFGWLPFAPLALAVATLLFVQVRAAGTRRPEYLFAVAWTVSQLGVALAVGLAGGPRVYLLPLFIFPVELGCVIFPRRAAPRCSARCSARCSWWPPASSSARTPCWPRRRRSSTRW